MKKIILYINTLLTISILSACGDFLEPQSQSETTPKDVNSLNELLLGNAIPTRTVNPKDITSLLTVIDDDITMHPFVETKLGEPSQYEERTILSLYQLYTWQPYYSREITERGAGGVVYNLYEAYYEYILGCNAVLDYLDKVTGSKAEKDWVKAQALSLRAFYYLQLVNIYAPPYNKDKNALGVVLKLTAQVEDKKLHRNTVQEVYTQIENDLLEAEQLFNELPVARQWKKDYRPSLPMVQFLLARMYLYMENWAEAAKYSSKIIDDWSFSLNDLNSYPNPATNIYFPDFKTYSSTESIWVYGISGNSNYGNVNTVFRSASSITVFEASKELTDSFEEGDLRKEKYIVQVNEGSGANARTVYRAYGKTLLTTGKSNPKVAENGFGHAFRLAEVYLIYAEAKAQLSSFGDAIDALNILRKKRFKPANYQDISGVSGNMLIELVRQERRKELCFEALRWFDLKRYGMPQIEHIWIDSPDSQNKYTLTQADNFYAVPIPYKVLDENSAIIQNPLPPLRQPN